MIKFFRKIRQKLLAENKFTKYLLYALGEIVLVVIGILIALQINNWNEARKTSIEEASLLRSLKNEMRYNSKELKRARGVNKSNIQGTGRLVGILTPNPGKEITDEQLASLLGASLSEKTEFQPRLSVINSEKLAIISNDSLKNLLRSIDSRVRHLEEHEKTVTQIRWDCTMQTLEDGNFRATVDQVMDTRGWYTTSKSAFKNTNQALLKSRQFENKLVLFLGTSINSEEAHLAPMSDLFNTIEALIDTELKKLEAL